MAITGARWGLESAEAILKLRSLRSSGDFDLYWGFHNDQELARNHTSRYECLRTLDGQVRKQIEIRGRKLAEFGAVNLEGDLEPHKVETFERRKAERQPKFTSGSHFRAILASSSRGRKF